MCVHVEYAKSYTTEVIEQTIEEYREQMSYPDSWGSTEAGREWYNTAIDGFTAELKRRAEAGEMV